MIKSIKIENYQSHKLTEVEFSPYLTVFTGLNNHGKSAILRAVKKVVRNAPLSDTFISDWSDTCEITLTCTNGVVVRKVRCVAASDSNMYIVNKDEYASFGTEVPPQVLDILNISPIYIFSDNKIDINFQGQLDTMFLVQGTGLASLRGKVLSRVTGVDIAQKAIQLCAGDERALNSEIKKLTEDKRLVMVELLAYDFLEKTAEEMVVVSKGISEIKELEVFIDVLTKAKQEIQDYVKKAKSLQTFITALTHDFEEDFTEINNRITIISLQKDTFNFMLRQKQLKDIISIRTDFNCEGMLHTNMLIKEAKTLITLSARMSKLKTITEIELPDVEQHVASFATIKVAKEVYALDIKRKLLAEKVNACSEISEVNELLNTVILVKNTADELSVLAEKIITLKQKVAEEDTELVTVTMEIDALQKELKVCPTCGKEF